MISSKPSDLEMNRVDVDQYVEPTELADRSINHLAAMLRVAQVALQRERTPAGILDPAHGFLRVVMFVVIGDCHIGPLTGESDRNRAADAAVAAGDKRAQSLEFAPPR